MVDYQRRCNSAQTYLIIIMAYNIMGQRINKSAIPRLMCQFKAENLV